MSGSLARLVLLTQGQLPVAEPLLPSRFAPIGPTPATIDPLENRDTPPAPQLQRALQFPVATRLQQDTAAAESEPIAPPSLARSDTAPLPVRAPPVPPGAPAQTPEFVARAAASRPLPPAPGGREAGSLGKGSPDRIEAGLLRPASGSRAEAEPLQPAPRRPLTAPFVPVPADISGAARATQLPAAAGVSASRVPDVQISIGRVEVHAAPARAVPVHPAPMRRPHLSLADYLASRK